VLGWTCFGSDFARERYVGLAVIQGLDRERGHCLVCGRFIVIKVRHQIGLVSVSDKLSI
jgi:hypothetical protein